MSENNPTELTKPKSTRGKRRQPPPADAVANTNGSTALVPTKPRKASVHFSEEVAERLFERLRAGETLRAICKDKTMPMPSEGVVRLWASEDTPFAAAYKRAREIGCQTMADQILEISDSKDGDPQWARLQVDSRKFLLAKILPSVYGERLEVKNTGGIVVVKLDADDLAL